ncbi:MULTISPECIES: glycosyltransferase [Chryseobacterium]|uniref:glycosyltransferase n=1 Tax=Chryseobacterium TaxID=59732 RepID=UPI00195BA956|nr:MULTISPECIES: glycosyltransferase [Chryseobacterium]MBM7419182.1 glycosyltransferase involved in cell wall biosynthesis [Chryseobacterium sp. JUb44]MDH6209105.1 glycosyltransferase involved in cell wall biosynthesis [Chryseobacterium sp. BIGb0186]WSO11956.1 glycosyltransferase [Chryseobacterium scophthalmum]
MKIGIDASRNRSGGAKAHIIGIINDFDESFLENGIEEIHIWSFPELLAQLPNKTWLIKHTPDELNKSIIHQLWWQYKKLPIEAKNQNIDILLNTDAGTVCRFKPSVTMSRDMLSYEKGEMKRFGFSKQRIRLELLKLVQNNSLKKSTAAIFLTQYASKVIQQSSGKISNVKIIPHGVSNNFRVLTNNGFWNEEKKEIKCIYVSNVELYKHQWNVALAIQNIKNKGYNVSIDFIGGGAGKAQLKFDKTIKTINNNEYLVQHDFVVHSKLPQLIQEKDIFIFASSCENMPNTLIEGMSSGLPIACSNRGPMPEVLQDGGVYFNPENVEEIENAIMNIITNSIDRMRISKRALELSDFYSWKRCSKETFEYLIEINQQNNIKL